MHAYRPTYIPTGPEACPNSNLVDMQFIFSKILGYEVLAASFS